MRKLTSAAIAALLVGGVGLTAVGGATAGGVSSTAAFFESDFDGVWVGSVAVKTRSGVVQRPLLLNLDADKAEARGAVLGAESMDDVPGAIVATGIEDGAIKRNKLTFSLPESDGEGGIAATHDFVLRLRKGRLKGKMSSNAATINGKSKVELVGLDDAKPFQQVWIGELDASTARMPAAAAPVALFLNFSSKSKGAGIVGDLAGTVTDVSVDGGAVDVTLATDEGDVRLALATDGALLAGAVTGAAAGAASLAAGGVSAAVQVTDASPRDLPAGSSTEVTINGKNLPDGSMVHVDHADVYGGVPTIDKGKSMAVRLIVGKNVPADTELRLQLMLPSGEAVEVNKTLRSSAGGGGVSFSLDLQPIFNARCATSGCHAEPDNSDPAYGNGQAAGNLVLAASSSYGSLVNRPSGQVPDLLRVHPGNADDSYLIRKLRGVGNQGDRMPQGGPFLSEAQIAKFVEWINAGAPFN